MKNFSGKSKRRENKSLSKHTRLRAREGYTDAIFRTSANQVLAILQNVMFSPKTQLHNCIHDMQLKSSPR